MNARDFILFQPIAAAAAANKSGVVESPQKPGGAVLSTAPSPTKIQQQQQTMEDGKGAGGSDVKEGIQFQVRKMMMLFGYIVRIRYRG